MLVFVHLFLYVCVHGGFVNILYFLNDKFHEYLHSLFCCVFHLELIANYFNIYLLIVFLHSSFLIIYVLSIIVF